MEGMVAKLGELRQVPRVLLSYHDGKMNAAGPQSLLKEFWHDPVVQEKFRAALLKIAPQKPMVVET